MIFLEYLFKYLLLNDFVLVASFGRGVEGNRRAREGVQNVALNS